MQPCPKTVTVLVDSREKYPLLFPASVVHTDANGHRHLVHLAVDRTALASGDYALKGYESVCLVERKGSVRELIGNLMSMDKARALSAFLRLMSVPHPILVLDFHYHDFAVTPDGAEAHDRLLHLLTKGRSGVVVLYAGGSRSPNTRRHVGGLLVQMMLVAVLSGGQAVST